MTHASPEAAPPKAAAHSHAAHRRRLALALALVAAAGAAQLAPFLAGHNVTADDTMFQQFAWELGWGERIENALGWATSRQRIPLFFSNMVSISLGGWIETLWSRVANLAVFAACLAAFAVHLGRLFGRLPAAAFALVAVAASPLAYHHMPPTSYPFFPTVQALVWLLLRFAVLSPRLAPRPVARLGLRALEGLVLLSSEYVLFLAAPLMAMQALARSGPSPHRLSRDPLLKGDTVLLAIVVAVQVIHRAALTGTGYIAVGEADFGAGDVLRVAALHAWHGTVFAYLANGDWAGRGWAEVAAALALGAAVAGAALALPRNPVETRAAMLAIPGGLLLAAVIVLPVASMDKYLSWCIDGRECAYIESRFAGWGLMLALAGPFALALARLPGRWRALPALALGGLAGLTLLNNLAVAGRMEADARPWREAARLACLFPDAEGPRAGALADLLTAEHIQWHPFFDTAMRKRYWRRHLDRLRAGGRDCPSPPAVPPAMRVPLDAAEDAGPWVIGWGKGAGYHRLSAARHGAVALTAAGPLAEETTLVLEVSVNAPPERVIVRPAGGRPCRATLYSEQASIAIPVGAQAEGATVAALVSLPGMAPGTAPESPQALLRPTVTPLAATLGPTPDGAVKCGPLPE